MSFLFMLGFVLVLLPTVPEPTKVLALAAMVYALLQGAKQSPWLGQYLTGWIAVAVNVGLVVLGVLVVVPADQLYTLNTLQGVLLAVLAAAGIHGTVSKVLMGGKG